MTSEEIKALREKAEKATPGPWCGPRITDDHPRGWLGVYAADKKGQPLPKDVVGVTGRYDEAQQRADAEYIAAVDPDTILWLINEAERQGEESMNRAERRRAEKTLRTTVRRIASELATSMMNDGTSVGMHVTTFDGGYPISMMISLDEGVTAEVVETLAEVLGVEEDELEQLRKEAE